MAEQDADPLGDALQRQRALLRWDGDGGAGPDGPLATLGPDSG